MMTKEKMAGIIDSLVSGNCPECSGPLQDHVFEGEEFEFTACMNCNWGVLHGLVASDGYNHTIGYRLVGKEEALCGL